MKVLILCAGNTMRTPLASKNAQPALLTVKGKPVIEHILDKIQILTNVSGVCIVTNASYHDKFKAWADDYSTLIAIKVINNQKSNGRDYSGSCAELAAILEKEEIKEDVLVIGGDNLFSFELNDFVDFAKTRRATATTGVYNLNGSLQPKKYGLLKLGADNSVIDFCEKPNLLNGLRLVSICLYYFPKEKLDILHQYTSQNLKVNSLGSYLEWLVKKEPVSGYRFEGEWFDVSDEEAYSEAVFSF
jgi:glucose-1-phosphate thymidylyltransferase